ncbi:MAG: 4Fe-4S binding protein [Desulfatibacillaceae bacterium]
MSILAARRISQVFFLALFLWFCLATEPGEQWYRLRGWPVNWFLQLDPLAALATMLATGVLFAGMTWALVTIVLSLVLGRFFCGWVCPFGTMHHGVSYVSMRGRTVLQNVERNKPSGWQGAKYAILGFFVGAAAAGFLARPVDDGARLAAGAVFLTFLVMAMAQPPRRAGSWKVFAMGAIAAWVVFLMGNPLAGGSMLAGLLDPIALAHRGVNLVLLPVADGARKVVSTADRGYVGAWAVGVLFLGALAANMWRPRFYCRYVCPLGALFGLIGGRSLLRIGKRQETCRGCLACEAACHGACRPTGAIRTPECVMCMNCLAGCADGVIGYGTRPSAMGEEPMPDFGRRGFIVAAAAGAAAIPAMRLSAYTGTRPDARLVRPPGSVAEPDFLARCLRCGQCMRVCPTNVIHPAGLGSGVEALWTPVLDFRAGISGCRHNCVLCGHVCPTAAIRPLTMEQRMGAGRYADQGPVRCGTAFIDRGRCLPWAMDRPCIVCQENCPVSPKAIYTRIEFRTVRGGELEAVPEGSDRVRLTGAAPPDPAWTGGDHFCVPIGKNAAPRRITGIQGNTLRLTRNDPWPRDLVFSRIAVRVRLLLPFVDPAKCIGCGVCENVCPVHTKRAIRVSPENATRSPKHRLLAGRSGGAAPR